MRIAIIINSPITQRGGVEVIVETIITLLGKEAHLFLVSPDSIKEISCKPWYNSIVGHFNNSNDPSHSKLSTWILDRKIRICHFHLSGSFCMSEGKIFNQVIPKISRYGISCITTNHQLLTPEITSLKSNSKIRKFLHFIKRWPAKAIQLKAVKAELHVSIHDMKKAIFWFPFYRNKMGMIYHSRWTGEPENSFSIYNKTILCLATVCFRKGQDLLAEAFSKIAIEFPDWNLHLVGCPVEVACCDRIHDIIAKYKLEDRIKITGETHEPDQEFRKAGIYVQPSRIEGLGLSLQEAMWHGIPCIAGRIGGMTELLESQESGLLVNAGNIYELSEAMKRLMSDADLRKNMGGKAMISISRRKMNRENMVYQYKKIYSSIG